MVKFDQKTRAKYPNINQQMLNPAYNISGCFEDSRFPPEHIQKVHINPPPSVRLTQDKEALLLHLAAEGYVVPDHAPKTAFITDGMFDLSSFEEFYESLEDFIIMEIAESLAKEIGDYAEILALIGAAELPGGSLLKLPQGYQSAQVHVIPNAAGRALNLGTKQTSNGVLSHSIPSAWDRDAAFAMAKNSVDEIGLDYGHVTLIQTPKEEMLIANIETMLRPSDIIAIRGYADMLNKALNGKK